MRLPQFILENMDRIIANWEEVAGMQMPAAAHMTPLELRNHSRQILESIVEDLATHQTEEAQIQKSLGQAPVSPDAPETAAQIHAALRVRSDFDINQLAAEYRALRASVLRLWMTDHEPDADDVEDIIRFNEAIDEALAESVDLFSAKVEQARNLMLGMIGHDLRNPLQAIQLTSEYLAALNVGEEVSRASARLINSGARMQALLDDLVVFNRHKLGLGFRIRPSEVNLTILAENEVGQFRASHPGRQLELQATGDTTGYWDPDRLHQLLSNLLSNALKHSADDEPVRVLITGEEAGVRLEVRNGGAPIDPRMLQRIFDPLTSGSDQQVATDHSLGLGLFIAKEITAGHGGDIKAYSEGQETVFAVELPRHPL